MDREPSVFFLRNFVLLFQKILSKINRIYSDGKCPRHPFLNFLDPSLLIVLRNDSSLGIKGKNERAKRRSLKSNVLYSPPLVKRVDVPNNTLAEYLVLVHSFKINGIVSNM